MEQWKRKDDWKERMVAYDVWLYVWLDVDVPGNQSNRILPPVQWTNLHFPITKLFCIWVQSLWVCGEETWVFWFCLWHYREIHQTKKPCPRDHFVLQGEIERWRMVWIRAWCPRWFCHWRWWREPMGKYREGNEGGRGLGERWGGGRILWAEEKGERKAY